jgi:hypothetical protein
MTMNAKLLAGSAALSLLFTLGCGPSQTPETQEPQEVQQSAGCPKGQYLCISCDGLSTYCGDACLDCTPPAAPTGEVEAAAEESLTVCPSGQKLCPDCNGGALCARACPLCPPPTEV